MDLQALNRDPILRDTPLGRLRLERYGTGARAWVAVVVVPPGKFDPQTTPGRIVHTLEPGTDVFAAIYGKRFWEQREVHERWLAQQDAEDAAREREGRGEDDLSDDFRRHLEAVLPR